MTGNHSGAKRAMTPDEIRTNRWFFLLSLCLIIVAGLLAYANTFQAPFVFDDITNIVENPYVTITDLSANSIADILKSRSRNRPVANLTIAADYFFHQYRTAGYHAVNLLINILSAILVFLVTRQTMAQCRIRWHFLPLATALLWMTNPIQTQAVTYIVQRMTSLATLFSLLSLYAYIRARRLQIDPGGRQKAIAGWYTVCGLSFLLGLGTKEITALLPLFIFLYEWYFFRNLDRHWLRRQKKWIGLICLIFLAAAVVYLGGDPAEKFTAAYADKPFTMAQRLLTEPRVIVYYLSLLVFPHPARLNLDYHFPLSTSFSNPFTLLALLALIGLAAVAVKAAGRHRLFSFAVLWFLGNLMIESSFMGLAIIYEHRLYLPSVFPVIALVYGLYRFFGDRSTVIVLILIMTLISGIWTFQRNSIWQSNIKLWTDSARKAPANPRPYNHLGLARARTGQDTTQAVADLKTALGLSQAVWGQDHPLTAIHHYNLAEIYRITGDTERATSHYRAALALLARTGDTRHPGISAIYNDLGTLRKTQNDFDGAVDYYQKALAALPDPSENSKQIINAAGIYNNLGVAYAEQGEFSQAEKNLKKALDLLQKEFGNHHPYTLRAKKALKELAWKRQRAVE